MDRRSDPDALDRFGIVAGVALLFEIAGLAALGLPGGLVMAA